MWHLTTGMGLTSTHMVQHNLHSSTASRLLSVPTPGPVTTHRAPLYTVAQSDTPRPSSAVGAASSAGTRTTHRDPPTGSGSTLGDHAAQHVERSVGTRTHEEDDVEDDEQPSPELCAAGQQLAHPALCGRQW